MAASSGSDSLDPAVDSNDVSSVEDTPSASEEKNLFFDFWNDSHFGDIITVPNNKDDARQQYDFWLISSIYLQERFPDQKEFDANGNEYYPTDYYHNLLRAMFGDSIDYNDYLPKSENGLTKICDAYDYGYLYAELRRDLSRSFSTVYSHPEILTKNRFQKVICGIGKTKY